MSGRDLKAEARAFQFRFSRLRLEFYSVTGQRIKDGEDCGCAYYDVSCLINPSFILAVETQLNYRGRLFVDHIGPRSGQQDKRVINAAIPLDMTRRTINPIIDII